MVSLLKKYRRKGILLDTNLLLGFLIGSLDPRQLEGCKARTRYFGPEDFPSLRRFVARFDRIVTTPHVMTEVSNLAGRLHGTLRRDFRLLLRLVAATKMSERFEPSERVSENDDFLLFGLTDTAIAMTEPTSCLVLTDDAALANLLARKNVDVINFNHVRYGTW